VAQERRNGRRHPPGGAWLPRAAPADVIGVITKEHVADAVAAGIQAYPR